MPQSLAQVLIHTVFSTKDRMPFLSSSQLRSEVHAYLVGILRGLDCDPIRVGGVADHVHILSSLSRTISIAELVKNLKTSSTRILKEKGATSFRWQSGYGAFSVSQSSKRSVLEYITNQESHHQKITFQDEFRNLLAKYQVRFDERYVWD
jgi:REP-associated tyrosine transposase